MRDGQRPPPASESAAAAHSAVLDVGVRTQILEVLLGNDLELFLAQLVLRGLALCISPP